MLTNFECEVERKKCGLTDKFTTAAKQPIAEHVAD
jgi:hypothetical protein